MKVQSLAIIFAIIVLPIIIIISTYIQTSAETIKLQNSYNTKLIDSTHDAMVAFELNTANEDLSSVADSLRSIIDASTNVFFNTLATNLGMSNANKEYIQSYVPAILYTLYDGYYIYAPTRVPTVLTTTLDGKVVYVGDNGVTIAGSGKYNFDENIYNHTETDAAKSARQAALYQSLANKYEYGQMLYENEDGTYSTEINENTVYNQDYILKTYMPYSARYLEKPENLSADQNFDLTINYTLDNYLTIEGRIGDIYYSKTGYLIAKDVVKSISAGGTDLLEYNEDDAEDICLSGKYYLDLKIQPMTEDGITRTSQELEIYYEPWEENGVKLTALQLEEKLDKLYENQDDPDTLVLIQELEFRLANLKAITYYAKAQIFSNWVYENLGTDGLAIKGSNIARDIASLNEDIYTTKSELDILYNLSEDNNVIFSTDIDPEKKDSPFYSHKQNIIRNAIQYNLNLAMSSYDEMAGSMNISMPMITDEEWDKILNNISIVTFMQGLNCGMKTYNNYAIVSSTNNELTVIPSEIYYTKKNEYNTSDISHLYHRIDCPEHSGESISFTSKEIKYDKIYDKNTQNYKYDHRNIACYNCITNRNYLKEVDSDGNLGYEQKVLISALNINLQTEYFRAVAKERQNLYKTNALTSSDGYEVLFTSDTNSPTHLTFDYAENANLQLPLNKYSSLAIKKIKAIEVTIRDIKSGNENEATATFHAVVGQEILEDLVVNLQQAAPQTINIPVYLDFPDSLTELELIKKNPEDAVECNLLNIRVIYE